jgi:hypothetical protein
MDPELIASLRERSRPRRAEMLLTNRSLLSPGVGEGREGQLQPVVDDLVTRLEQLEDRLARLNASGTAEAEPAGHTLFATTPTGYTIIERDGPAPPPGAEVSVDGRAYRVTAARSSPFPGDRRPCVIVEGLGG